MFNNKLALLLAVGAVLRLGLWLWFFQGQTLHDDEHDYHRLAVTMVEQGEYGFRPGELTSLRPPLYPALVAAVYSVCGVENLQAVRLVQAALGVATILLVYHLGKQVYSEAAGLTAAAIYAVYPSLAVYCNLILTETLFTFLLTAWCLALVCSLKSKNLLLLAGAGVLLGLGALTRSVLWMFPPVLVVFLVFAWPGTLRERFVGIGLVLLTFALPVTPWAIRNTRLQKTFTAVDCMGGRNFMMGNYQHTPLFGSWATIGLQGPTAWHHEVHAENPAREGRSWTQGEIDKLALKQGLKFVVAHPGLTMQRDAVKFLDFWGLERELISGAMHDYYGSLPKPMIGAGAILILGTYVCVLFAGIFGAVLCRAPNQAAYWALVLVVVHVCGIHTLVFGHSRYHLPLMPLVMVYAAAAWVRLRELAAARQTWGFRLAASACVLLLSGWVFIFVAEDASRLQRLLQRATSDSAHLQAARVLK